MQPKLFDGFCSVVRLCHYAHVNFRLNQRGDPFAQQRMVVNREYPNQFGIAAHDFFLRKNLNFALPCEFMYAMVAGTLSWTSVPAPASLQKSNCAPIRCARSFTPPSPQCPWRLPSFRPSGSIPFPSSHPPTQTSPTSTSPSP